VAVPARLAAYPTILERLAALVPRRAGAIYGGMAIRTEEATEAQELREQAHAAADAICATVLRLLKEGEVDPRLVVLAVARVAGARRIGGAGPLGFLDRWSQPTNGCCRSPVTRAVYTSPT
jgi:hypothetical protein